MPGKTTVMYAIWHTSKGEWLTFGAKHRGMGLAGPRLYVSEARAKTALRARRIEGAVVAVVISPLEHCG